MSPVDTFEQNRTVRDSARPSAAGRTRRQADRDASTVQCRLLQATEHEYNILRFPMTRMSNGWELPRFGFGNFGPTERVESLAHLRQAAQVLLVQVGKYRQ